MTTDSAAPMISVVTCAYDAAPLLPDAIESALAQDYPASRREIIVVDDGSADGTREVLERYASDVRVVRHPSNLGMGEAMRSGIRAAVGDIVAPLDADDAWLPGKLRRVSGAFQCSADVALVSHRVQLADKGLRPFKIHFGSDRDRTFDLERERLVYYPPGSSTLTLALPAGSAYAFRRSAILKRLEQCRVPPMAADLFFLLMAAYDGRHAAYLAESLSLYRLRGNHPFLSPASLQSTDAALNCVLKSVDLARRPTLLGDVSCLKLPAAMAVALDRPRKSKRISGCASAAAAAWGKVPAGFWLRSACFAAACSLLPRKAIAWLTWLKFNARLKAYAGRQAAR